MLKGNALLLLVDGGSQQTCKHVKQVCRRWINPYPNVIVGDAIISKKILSGDRLLVKSYSNALR